MSRPELNKTRLAVDVPPAVKDRLAELRALTEADSMAEVVRRALAVYELLVKEGGRRPTLVMANGETQRVVLW